MRFGPAATLLLAIAAFSLPRGAAAQTGLDFDGTNDYVTFGQATSLGLQTFTIECWFKREGAGVTTSTGTGGITSAIPLVTKGRGENEGGNIDMNWFLGLRSTDNVLAADFEDNATGLNHPVFGVTPVATGTWYHAAATYDGTTWRLYLNGVLEATAVVGAFTPQNLSVQHAGIATAMTTAGTAAGFFNGVIDEARVWSGARTPAEIADGLDEEIASAPGLVGRWGLNEGAGTTAANSGTAAGVDGTLMNGPAWAPGSPFALPPAPDAIDFGGTNAYVNFGASAQFALGQFTLEMWMRRDGAGVGTDTGTGGIPSLVPLFARGRADVEDPTRDINYIFGIRASDGVIAADFEEGATGASPSLNHPVAGTTVLATGTWYHVAATYDGATWKLYVNGTLDGELAVGQPVATGSSVAASLASALRLDGTAGGFFDGAVDEVRVWDYARTAAEIYSTINSKITGAASGLVARWGLDEGAGTTVGSTAGTTLNGTVTGAAWAWSAGAPFDVGPPTAPAAPGGLTATALSATQVRLDWTDNSANEDAFDLERSTAGSGGPFTSLFAFPATSVRDGFDRADGAIGGSWGDQTSGFAIASYTLAPAGAGSYSIEWGGAVFGSDQEVHVTLASVDPAGTEHNLMLKTQGPTWDTGHIEVTYNAAGATVQVLTYAPGDGWVTAGTIPGVTFAAGDRFGARAFGDGTVEVYRNATRLGTASVSAWPFAALGGRIGLSCWNAAAARFDDFGGGDVPSVARNQTSYTDATVSAGTEYCYRVRARNAIGSSDWSNVACATPSATAGTALDLGGTNAYASVGNVLKLAQFTLELWFRRDGAGVGTNTGTGGIPDLVPILSKGRADAEEAARDINYIFGIRASDGVLAADFEEGPAGASPSLNHPVAGATPVAVGGWHHGAVTYDGATWRIYLDGNLDAELAVGQPAGSGSDVAVALGSALTLAGAASGYFDGAMDEVRVWNVARTQAEIQTTANIQITDPRAGLVARWALNEGSGSAVTGSAGTSISGTITGANYAWTGGAPFDLNLNLPPSPPALVAPADGATGVARPAQLAVTAEDPDGDPVTVTFYGRPVGAAGPDFTLVNIPDTQYYTREQNGGTIAMLNSQTQWVVDQKAARNIACVVQLGDCTEHGDNGGNDIEWQRADAAFDLLENPVTTGLEDGIPFGICVGNHDQTPMGDAAGTTTFYNQFFGEARFQGRAYYGGHHGSNNDNWYELFSAGGMDFIVVEMEYDTSPDADVLAWADQLLTTYSDRRAIVASHNLLSTGNPGTFSTQGSAVYNALRGHANLFLMLCGHNPGEGRRQDTDAGHTVHTLMADYQSRTNGGSGWLRYLEFSPANDVIRVRTYSPWLDQYEADADSSSQFTLAYPMSGSGPFQVIGTANVASGGTAQVSWAGLAADTEYEWYATVSDGYGTVPGPVWSLRTAEGVAPVVQVLTPNGGEVVTIGQAVNLTWSATDNVGVAQVDLLLSRTGAAGTYETLASGIPNTGAHAWTATGPATTDAYLKVVARDAAGNTGEDLSDAAFTIGAPTGVEEVAITEFALSAVSPNPARSEVHLAADLPAAAALRVQILDVQGRVVATLADGEYAAGRHRLVWNAGGRSAPGLYLARMQAAGRVITRRFLQLQ
jgi:hypothetical protein